MKKVAIDTTTEFNPMQDVPVNDEQVIIALRHERQADIADALCGIYQCERGLGLSVLNAYKTALLAHIAAHINAQQTCNKSTNGGTEQTWWAGYEYTDIGQTQE